jgi:hypothetical protein
MKAGGGRTTATVGFRSLTLLLYTRTFRRTPGVGHYSEAGQRLSSELNISKSRNLRSLYYGNCLSNLITLIELTAKPPKIRY